MRARSVQIAICEQPDFYTYAQCDSVSRPAVGLTLKVDSDIESARVLAQNCGTLCERHCIIAMTFKCLDCNLLIEGDPWWYDPLAVGINAGPPATLTGVVSQRPGPPTAAAAPFHKACLERQLGRSVDS